MKKTIGVLAHVDAGKTTFAEQILYHTESIRQRGRVDHKNAFLDSHNIEKDRGITVFSDQAIFNYNGSTYYLIDTPGHVDFSTEMERAIEVMDYGILIISAVEGVQAHTETVWELLRKYKIPTVFFINKIDREGGSVEKILRDISLKLTKSSCYIDESFSKDNMSSELIEFIAERDEILLDKYLENNFDIDSWINSMKRQIKNNEIFPCFCGSALKDIGIKEFINELDLLTYTNYDEKQNFLGRIYKIRYDEKGEKVTYIKALAGSIKVKENLLHYFHEEERNEKINQIRIYNGNKFILQEEAFAGDIFGVTGLTKFKVGDGLGGLQKKIDYKIVPTLKAKVIFDNSLSKKEILSFFQILEEEDPGLNVSLDEDLQTINVNIMGKIQLEVLKDIIKERFKFDIEFGECEVLYKETISNVVNGYGHFEPLRHYAEVILKIEPGEKNSGITFKNECHVDNLAISYQNLIKSHIFEKEHKGILTGSKLTDLKITLINGRAHLKHTSGGDFREATYRALRYGLEQANNILLEPFYKFKITVSTEYIGKVLSDIQRLNGTFETPELLDDKNIIIGKGPVSTFMNYPLELIAFTHGLGNINLIFDGYYICHNTEEIINKIAYNKNSDRKYTSSSIFCSKGQGYIVEWKDAKNHMHCLK
ncbi:TetM/TetW/TetO/TetS family tetracycline resistance ribosomal protection protein [Clostridium sp. CTA-5]